MNRNHGIETRVSEHFLDVIRGCSHCGGAVEVDEIRLPVHRVDVRQQRGVRRQRHQIRVALNGREQNRISQGRPHISEARRVLYGVLAKEYLRSLLFPLVVLHGHLNGFLRLHIGMLVDKIHRDRRGSATATVGNDPDLREFGFHGVVNHGVTLFIQRVRTIFVTDFQILQAKRRRVVRFRP